MTIFVVQKFGRAIAHATPFGIVGIIRRSSSNQTVLRVIRVVMRVYTWPRVQYVSGSVVAVARNLIVVEAECRLSDLYRTRTSPVLLPVGTTLDGSHRRSKAASEETALPALTEEACDPRVYEDCTDCRYTDAGPECRALWGLLPCVPNPSYCKHYEANQEVEPWAALTAVCRLSYRTEVDHRAKHPAFVVTFRYAPTPTSRPPADTSPYAPAPEEKPTNPAPT